MKVYIAYERGGGELHSINKSGYLWNMAVDNGWLQDIEKINEPELDPNIARSSVFRCLRTRNMNWCNDTKCTDNKKNSIPIFENDCTNGIAMSRLDEDIRNFRRHLKLERRRRDDVEHEFQDRTTANLKWSIDHHRSIRHIVKTA